MFNASISLSNLYKSTSNLLTYLVVSHSLVSTKPKIFLDTEFADY